MLAAQLVLLYILDNNKSAYYWNIHYLLLIHWVVDNRHWNKLEYGCIWLSYMVWYLSLSPPFLPCYHAYIIIICCLGIHTTSYCRGIGVIVTFLCIVVGFIFQLKFLAVDITLVLISFTFWLKFFSGYLLAVFLLSHIVVLLWLVATTRK